MIIPRPAWGALAPVGDLPPVTPTLGFLTVHGMSEPGLSEREGYGHDQCAFWMAASQLLAMTNGGQDIPWTAVICPHGEIYEGRGIMAAPGVDVGHGVVEAGSSLSLMIRSNDLGGLPTAQQMWVLRWYLNSYIDPQIPGLTLVTHRDWDPTATCPGGGIVEAVAELNAERSARETTP